MTRMLAAAMCIAAGLAGCSLGSGDGSSSPAQSQAAAPQSTGTPPVIGSLRTVLVQLGLNLHADASTTARVVGVAGQGATLTVLDYQAANGGWFKVRGETVTGWIVADPALSAQGLFTQYQSTQFNFSALYPQTWTFNQQPGAVIFRPQQGMQTIVVRTGSNTAAFGPQGPAGYAASASKELVVCGYTGELVEYAIAAGAATATPAVAGAALLPRYAEIRLRFDSAHAIQLAYNYSDESQFDVFGDFYNSITFPYSQCEQGNPATPSPT